MSFVPGAHSPGMRQSSPGLLLAEAHAAGAKQQRKEVQKVPRQIPDPEPWTNAPSRQHSQQPLSIPWAPRPDSRNTPPPKPKKESPFTIEQLQQKRSQWQDQRQLAESRMLQRGRQLLNRVQERSYGGAIGLHKPLTASACVTTRSMMRSCPGAVSLNERQLIDQMFEKAQNSVKLSKRQQRMDAEQRPPPRQQQWTPLHAAASQGNVAMVEVLLEAKADAFSTNRWDFSPLYFAQKYGHDDVVAILRAC